MNPIADTKAVRSALSSTVILACMLGAVPLGTMTGCAILRDTTVADPGPEYPAQATKSGVVDVQVFRNSTKLRFTNTTPTDFGPSRLWLNQRYSYPIDRLDSGQTLEMDLRLFVDSFGDTFRAGGFYAQRIPAPVVLAELETPVGQDNPGSLIGFIVVENQID